MQTAPRLGGGVRSAKRRHGRGPLMTAAVRALLLDAADRGIRYRESLDARPVAPTAEATAALDQLRQPLPEPAPTPRPCSPARPARLAGHGDDGGGRYFGFVNGSSLPVTVAANWLATAWDQNSALQVMSPRRRRALEPVALRWTLDALRLPADVRPAPSSSARRWRTSRRSPPPGTPCCTRAGWNVEADGLFGAPPITVVVGEEVHADGAPRARPARPRPHAHGATCRSTARAASAPTRLPPLDGPTHRVHPGGQREHRRVRSGAELCAWAQGAAARGCTSTARSASGRAPRRAAAHLADGHRRRPTRGPPTRTSGSTCPYDCGIAMVRDDEALRAAMAMTAALPAAVGRRAIRCTTRPTARGARAGWTCGRRLRSSGRDGLAELVERSCRHAARFAGGPARRPATTC